MTQTIEIDGKKYRLVVELGFHIADIEISGNLISLAAQFSKFTPAQARRIANHLLKCAEFIELKEKKK